MPDSSTSSSPECDCGFSGDWFACIGGEVYGPCEHELCGGVCEPDGRCLCDCHKVIIEIDKRSEQCQ